MDVKCVICGKEGPEYLTHDSGWVYLYSEVVGTNLETGEPATARDCLNIRTPVSGGLIARYMCPECATKMHRGERGGGDEPRNKK